MQTKDINVLTVVLPVAVGLMGKLAKTCEEYYRDKGVKEKLLMRSITVNGRQAMEIFYRIEVRDETSQQIASMNA